MINYKTQLEELKKKQDTESPYSLIREGKITLLSQIIDDLKKEWQRLNNKEKIPAKLVGGALWVIEEITGMSSEELKEVLNGI